MLVLEGSEQVCLGVFHVVVVVVDRLDDSWEVLNASVHNSTTLKVEDD